MAKKKGRGNGTGTVYPRRNKQGKIIGYRGSYWVQSGEVPKRLYVSGKTKTQVALNKARADRDGGFVYDAGTLTVGEYLSR
jgi:integrase